MPSRDPNAVAAMRRALELAALGQGFVEPNPMVGCVLLRDGRTIGEGYHHRFGGPHAEVEALRHARDQAHGATAYVTLEPCAHFGKTPPCTQALIAAGVQRVVVATRDPFPEVAGRGLDQLRAAGVEVDVGLLEREARELNAPFFRLVEQGRPFVLAKWAMTLCGHIATHTGSSQWISSPQSRDLVHQLRGRMDAILVGSTTARRDDPQLTARPPGARLATRIVFDRLASLPPGSRLVQSAREAPVIVAASPEAPRTAIQQLTDRGVEVLVLPGASHSQRLSELLHELGRRRMTNLLAEGGGGLLGGLFDLQVVDEVHVFLAAKIVGGQAAPVPIAGGGLAEMAQAWKLDNPALLPSGPDVYLRGRLTRPSADEQV